VKVSAVRFSGEKKGALSKGKRGEGSLKRREERSTTEKRRRHYTLLKQGCGGGNPIVLPLLPHPTGGKTRLNKKAITDILYLFLKGREGTDPSRGRPVDNGKSWLFKLQEKKKGGGECSSSHCVEGPNGGEKVGAAKKGQLLSEVGCGKSNIFRF